jgi:hypothetical protein
MPKKQDKYPEHTKLQALQGESQKLGDFLTWLREEQGVTLCTLEEGRVLRGALGRDTRDDPSYQPWGKNIEKVLALYFEVDTERLESEKRAMLDEIRAAQVDRTARQG